MTLTPEERDLFRRFIRDPEPEFVGWMRRQLAASPAAYNTIMGAPLKGKKIRYGRDTATWTADWQSALKTVAHGLGVVPAVTLLTFEAPAIFGTVDTTDATNITLYGRDSDKTVRTDTYAFNWLAIG